MKKTSTNHAAPGGSSDPKSGITVATGKLSKVENPEIALLRRLTRGLRQHRPATFPIFWGEVLDTNPRLRKIRDKSAIAITRAELKRMLLQAFIAGGSK